MDKAPVRPSTSTSSRAPGRSMRDLGDSHEEALPVVEEDMLTSILHSIIHFAVRVLAILMVLVILWGIADVAYVMYQRLVTPPFMLLTASDILVAFGSIMTVLIAIEIFVNITLYIKRDVLPIKMVIATALMAIARKVIMLDFNDLEALYIFSIAAVIVALGLTYWLISYKPKPVQQDER